MGQQLRREIPASKIALSKAERRKYDAPHLLEYGNVAKLTQGNNGTGVDSDTTRTKKMSFSGSGPAPLKMR